MFTEDRTNYSEHIYPEIQLELEAINMKIKAMEKRINKTVDKSRPKDPW